MLKFLAKLPIKWRLSLAYALIMGILFTGLGMGIYRLVKDNLLESVDAALQTSAQAIRQSRQSQRIMTAPVLENFLTQFLGERNIRLYATLIDLSNNKTRLQTRNIHIQHKTTQNSIRRARLGLSTFETFDVKKNPIRQITLPAKRRGRFTGEIIQVGASLAPTFATLKSLKIVLLIAFPIALLCSIFCGYWITRRSIQPVQRITKAAANIHIEDLSNRLPLPVAQDELRELTKTFNSMLDRLEDSFKRHKRFTGDVSHELRTSLAVLTGEAQLALRKERDSHYYKEALGVITDETAHMSKIVEDLLLLSRAQSRSVAMQWQTINASEFFYDIQNAVKNLLNEKSIRLAFHIPTDFEEFIGSETYLHIVIKNILVNAIKHSPQNSEIIVNIEQSDAGSIEISIQDHGEGIPKDAQPYIFDSFFRADTARNRTLGGAGVGLSLALALTKLHKGNIVVESTVGEGSTFTISIPQNPENLEPTEKAAAILPAEKPIGLNTSL